MAITGYQFDRAKVTVKADASLYYFLSDKRNIVFNNIGNNLNVTAEGMNVNIDTGQALIQGRLIEITASETITIPSNTEGYVCITIDLNQINTSSGTPGQSDYQFVIGQLKTEFVTSLIQQDLNNNGTIYNFPLAKVTSTDNSISITKVNSSYEDTDFSILDMVYPIGSLYWSMNNIDPNKLFGGTWQSIGTNDSVGRFPSLVSPLQNSNVTGGNKTHRHDFRIGLYSYSNAFVGGGTDNSMAYKYSTNNYGNPQAGGTFPNVYVNDSEINSSTPKNVSFYYSVGDTQTTDSTPPYITCYCWRRVS